MHTVKWESPAPKQGSVVFDLDQVNVYGLAVIELDAATP
jgi:hypothetical protein